MADRRLLLGLAIGLMLLGLGCAPSLNGDDDDSAGVDDDDAACPPGEPSAHRVTAPVCDSDRGLPEPDLEDLYNVTCTSHADCTAGLNGACVVNPIYKETECSYDACVLDADCGPGQLCVCEGTWHRANRCVTADCATDGDCGDDLWCVVSADECSVATRVACRSCDDACVLDTDCGADSYGDPGSCRFDEATAAWGCVYWPSDACYD